MLCQLGEGFGPRHQRRRLGVVSVGCLKTCPGAETSAVSDMAPRGHVAHLAVLQDNIRESVLPYLEKERGIRVAGCRVQVHISVLGTSLGLFIEDGSFRHEQRGSGGAPPPLRRSPARVQPASLGRAAEVRLRARDRLSAG